MVKEAQLVCVRSSFSKRFDIVGGGERYFLMRRTFVIYKDATSSLPNLHQGVQESWPKQAQVSWFNKNILSSQKSQSSNPTTLIFDKNRSSSIQKWLSALRRSLHLDHTNTGQNIIDPLLDDCENYPTTNTCGKISKWQNVPPKSLLRMQVQTEGETH